MTQLKAGDKAPTFSLPNQENKIIKLHDFTGKKVILYFYPKDDTPGCTTQACNFRDQISDFSDKNVVILGVSKDGVNSHDKFHKKFSLNFNLLSDESGAVCESYKVFKEKSMFGKTFLGLVRSTFLIDENGLIQKCWYNVKVDGHWEKVLKVL